MFLSQVPHTTTAHAARTGEDASSRDRQAVPALLVQVYIVINDVVADMEIRLSDLEKRSTITFSIRIYPSPLKPFIKTSF